MGQAEEARQAALQNILSATKELLPLNTELNSMRKIDEPFCLIIFRIEGHSTLP